MFYRLGFVNELIERLNGEWGNLGTMFNPRDFKGQYKEVVQTPPWTKCRIFHVPELDVAQHMSYNFKFEKGSEFREIPDVSHCSTMLVVSESAKNIIEQVDDFDHQFAPMKFLDWQENEVQHGYYMLHARRVLEIEPMDVTVAELMELDFDGLHYEDETIQTIRKTPALREKIETLPIWRQDHLGPVYINEILLQEFKKHNLTGLEEYSEPGGIGEESLGHV